ncbi:MAG: hypothetical protein NWE92_05510 [Candidatus Bathyarchaeota archaeon]|nr:hypothetical protein [Candidatus Bathyarchaeota archaeon]
MGTWLQKYGDSYRFWILVVACTYFAYAVYYMASGMRDSIGMLSNQWLYSSLSVNPWWWMVLFYSSEGAGGSVAIIVRAVAGVFAVYGAYLFWRKKDTLMPRIKRCLSIFLLLEAVFYLTLIPSIIAAAVYNLAADPTLFYFGHTPEALLLYVTFIPCTAIVLVVPPLLLKLRTTINHNASTAEIGKWASLAGVGYLFVVFWFNFSMMWSGVAVPYTRVYEQYGLDFMLQPANLFSFVLTVFGLLAVALTALFATLPLIKQQPKKPSLAGVGAALAGLGGYFITTAVYYYATGGYSAHPSVWYEVIGPLHNPNLWVISLVFLGLSLIFYRRNSEK